MAVNGGDVALELRVLAGFAVDREHGIKDLPSVVGGALLGLAERGTDELRVGRIEVLAQLLDEMHEVLLVSAGKRGTTAVPIALPPEEARDLVFLRTGVILVEFSQHLLRSGNIAVVLHAGVPVDLLRLRAFLPALEASPCNRDESR